MPELTMEHMEEEEEEDSEEDQIHQKLLKDVTSVTKKSYVDQRTEGAIAASEYHLPPLYQDGKVSMDSLLNGLGKAGGKSLLALKKRLTAVEEKSRPLEPPLNKIQADKVNRKAANQETSKAVGKWAPIVKRNREADHLSFPLQQNIIPAPSLSTKVESFTPSTELELKVAAILEASENMESEDQELTEAEKKSLFQMSVEEAMERKESLQKHRALVSYYEQKCRRIRRIKSKKFHKIKRKRLEKLGNMPEMTEEELIKLRAKERMTLKHSHKAKWAKKQKAREHRDPATQQALSEHHQRKNELKQKFPDQKESSSESEEDGGDQEVEEGAEHSNPWLKSPASQASGSLKATNNSFSSIKTASNPRDTTKKTTSNINHGDGGHIDTTSFMLDTRGTGRGDLGVASKQLLAVKEAFSGDNVVEEFEKEKAELEAKEMEDDTPVVMPGWGNWGGDGVRPPKKNPRIPKQRPPPRQPRQDAGMNHVIIYEGGKTSKKVAQHLVQSVPWPYTSKDQFNKTHSTPVGRHWNTESAFQQMIKPRVEVDQGEIINPLVLTEDVKDYITRSEVKKKEKARSRKKKKLS